MRAKFRNLGYYHGIRPQGAPGSQTRQQGGTKERRYEAGDLTSSAA